MSKDRSSVQSGQQNYEKEIVQKSMETNELIKWKGNRHYQWGENT